MANGRCANHGGKSTGPPLGSQNGLKHGIYAAGHTDEENELANEMLLGSVDEELKVCRIQLRRAIIAQRKWLDAEDQEKVLTLSEVSIETGAVAVAKDCEGQPTPAPIVATKRVHKATDYDTIIHRLTGRIGELERVRSEIGGGQADYLSAARKIKEALRLIEESVPGD